MSLARKGGRTWSRIAVRLGCEDGEVTLGGRRPRVRSAGGEGEVPFATYQDFADRDPLVRVVLGRILAGVSTRRYRRTQESLGEDVETRAGSTSKSSVLLDVRERSCEELGELMSRQLSDLRLVVMMLDGLELKGRMIDRRACDHDRGP